MLGIAHGELGGNRIAGDLALERTEFRLEPGAVELGHPVAMGVVAAGEHDDRIVLQRLRQVGACERPLVEPDQHQAHPAALALDHRIGRKRGRQGDQRDVLRAHVMVRQHGIERIADADREVVARGQRLGGGDNAFVFVEQDGIRVGAAGVDAEQNRHGSILISSPDHKAA